MLVLGLATAVIHIVLCDVTPEHLGKLDRYVERTKIPNIAYLIGVFILSVLYGVGIAVLLISTLGSITGLVIYGAGVILFLANDSRCDSIFHSVKRFFKSEPKCEYLPESFNDQFVY